MKDEELKIVEEMQLVVAQMKLDDIEEDPDSEVELFQCDSCGEDKPRAGSVMYGEHTLCNDCVLYAEVGFALGKIDSVDDVMKSMEELRLKHQCQFILEDQARLNN